MELEMELQGARGGQPSPDHVSPPSPFTKNEYLRLISFMIRANLELPVQAEIVTGRVVYNTLNMNTIMKEEINHKKQPIEKPEKTPRVTLYMTFPKAGISVWASQKLKTSLGPVMSSFGVNPLKKLLMPSCLTMLLMIRSPDSGFSNFRAWIRVLITSRGAETTRDALAPAMEATKFCPQVAEL
jgi:hypothetical protein